jgi:hypothetical protein
VRQGSSEPSTHLGSFSLLATRTLAPALKGPSLSSRRWQPADRIGPKESNPAGVDRYRMAKFKPLPDPFSFRAGIFSPWFLGLHPRPGVSTFLAKILRVGRAAAPPAVRKRLRLSEPHALYSSSEVRLPPHLRALHPRLLTVCPFGADSDGATPTMLATSGCKQGACKVQTQLPLLERRWQHFLCPLAVVNPRVIAYTGLDRKCPLRVSVSGELHAPPLSCARTS